MTQYYVLHPSTFKLDGGAMFGIIPKPLWSKNCHYDDQNRISLALRLLLVKTKNKNILIDTGIGDYHDEKFNHRFDVKHQLSPLTSCLAEIHLTPHDITDLVVSHLHFDHIGGLYETKTNECLFPNATIHLHKKHWDYALQPTPRDQGSFITKDFSPFILKMDQQHKVNWINSNEGIILADEKYQMHFMLSHGHTPYLLHAYDQHFIYMADLVPTSHHVPVPWVMGYDISPGQTTFDKMNFYSHILQKNLTMIFEHDPNFYGAKLSQLNNELKTELLKCDTKRVQEIYFS